MACRQHLCFSVAIFASFFCIILTACVEDDLYIIKSGGNSDMVLEGKDSLSLSVQYFSNLPSQLWKFERGSKVGYYYIINNQTGKAIDFQAEESKYKLVLVGKTKRNSPRQEWNLRIDGRIQNRENKRCFDIYTALFIPGTRVLAVSDNGNQAQSFILEKYKDFDLEAWKEYQSQNKDN